MSGILAAILGGGVNTFALNITSMVKPDIETLAYAQGWLGLVQPLRIVSTGLVNTLSIPASMDGGDILLDFTADSFIGGTAYLAGTALKTRAHIKVKNAGTLAAGGGRGGNGAGSNAQFRSPDYIPATSWGYGGSGGAGQGFANDSLTIYPAQSGAAGTSSGRVYGYSAGGGPVGGGGTPWAQAYGGNGGNGGAWGDAGSRGGASSVTKSTIPPGASYADYTEAWGETSLAGLAVDGNSYITWIMTGTRLGNII